MLIKKSLCFLTALFLLVLYSGAFAALYPSKTVGVVNNTGMKINVLWKAAGCAGSSKTDINTSHMICSEKTLEDKATISYTFKQGTSNRAVIMKIADGTLVTDDMLRDSDTDSDARKAWDDYVIGRNFNIANNSDTASSHNSWAGILNVDQCEVTMDHENDYTVTFTSKPYFTFNNADGFVYFYDGHCVSTKD